MFFIFLVPFCRASTGIIYLITFSTCSAQVKFTQDAIDETDTLEEVLRARTEALGGKLNKVVLNGNHLTPIAPVSGPTFIRPFLFLRSFSLPELS